MLTIHSIHKANREIVLLASIHNCCTPQRRGFGFLHNCGFHSKKRFQSDQRMTHSKSVPILHVPSSLSALETGHPSTESLRAGSIQIELTIKSNLIFSTIDCKHSTCWSLFITERTTASPATAWNEFCPSGRGGGSAGQWSPVLIWQQLAAITITAPEKKSYITLELEWLAFGNGSPKTRIWSQRRSVC